MTITYTAPSTAGQSDPVVAASEHRAPPFWLWLALAVVLVLAFGARVYRIDAQSLWADEGASVVMTHRSPAEIARAAAGDIHPPMYYLALRFWAELAGRSEYGLRLLSALQGVIVVALTFTIGKLLLDRWAALIGALFAAGSPLLIYYSQEARMYEQMAMLGLAGFAAALVWWRRARPGTATGLVLSFSAGVLSQYFAVTAMVGASLAFIVMHPNPVKHWRAYLGWALAMLAVIALVVPWLLYASSQLQSWSVDAEPLTPLQFVLQTLRYSAFGLAWDQTVTGKTLALAAAVPLAAVLWPLAGSHRLRRLQGLLSVTCLALAAPLTLFIVALNRPVYNPKFLLVSVPAFCLLQATGTVALAGIARRLVTAVTRVRPLGWAVAAALALVVIGAQGFAVGRSLSAAYFDPKYARDDYRGLVHYIETSARDGDVIVLNAPGQKEIFSYYYGAKYPVIGLPAQRPPVDAQTIKDLQDTTRQAKRIWLVLWASDQSDPRGVVEGWLNENTFRVSNRWYGGVRLVLYSVPMDTEAGEIQFPRQVQFESGIELLGYSLAAAESKPGEALQLTLFWRANQPVPERYTVFTHLIDQYELIWGQRDSEPGSGRRPTDSWQPGEVIADRYGLPVYVGTPPADFSIEVGLYRSTDGHRLGILDNGKVTSDRVLLGPVTIGRPDAKPSVDALFLEHPLKARQGPLTLLGFDFNRLGHDTTATDFHSGDLAHLTLYWRADSRPGVDRLVRIEVRDSAGNRQFSITTEPTNGLYPTSLWPAWEIVRDQHKFELNVPPGTYRLFAGLEGEALVELGTYEVQ